MEPPPPPEGGRRGLLGPVRAALNRNVYLLFLGGALLNLPIGFFFLVFPVYLGRLPTFPAELIGWPLGTLGLVAVGTMTPLGILADRFGRRRMLFLGSLTAAGAFLLFGLLDTFEGLLFAAAVLGVAEGFYFSVWNALLADASTPETRPTVFGLSFFVAGVAMALGSLVGIFADQAFQAGASPQEAYQPLFLGLAVLMLPVGLLVPLLRLPHRDAGALRSWFPQRSRSIIGKFVVANMMIGFGAGLLIPLLPQWFVLQFGAGETYTGPLYAVSSVVNAFAFLLAPALARRVGMVPAIVGAQGIATVLLFTMPFTPFAGSLGLPAAAGLFVARTALMNMVWPVATAFLMGAVHPDERATASGITGTFFRAPQSAAVFAGGYLFTVSLAFPFYITTFFYILGTVAFWWFFRGYGSKEATSPPGTPSEG